MRAILVATMVAGIGLVNASSAVAAPVSGAAAILGAVDEMSAIEQIRTFCYNRYTGRFKHWGPCGGGHPRVYCRNRYTGRFLYWGACRY
jgi:hypothetical protein